MNSRPRAADPATEQKALLESQLRSLYQEVDALYQDWSCPKSTDCCHFGRTGREPYVTAIEFALIEKARARSGVKKSSPRRSLPTVDRRCPMLGETGACSIYQARPFGCRTFYCDDAYQGTRVRHQEIVALVARLKSLAALYSVRGDDGRPLTRVLQGQANASK